MTFAQIFLGGGAAFVFAWVTLSFTRRRVLSERIALLWLLLSAGILVVVLFPDLMARLAALLGFALTSNAILVFAVLGLLIFNFFVTVKVSILEQRVRRLGQEMAVHRIDTKSVEAPR